MAKEMSGRPMRGGVLGLAAIGVVAAVAVSLALNYLLLFSDALGPFGRGVAISILVPILVGGPAFYAIGRLREQARELQRQLNRAATYDELTHCLNGRVFANMVERRRESELGTDQGAYLIIDASEVRAINRRHGVDWGEEALRLIADAIRRSVRAEDIVGRTSQNEFGIYLVGATEEEALDVGERIRAAVADVYFAPNGARDMLGVSVAGVVFEQDLEYPEMVREAARQLPARGVGRKVALSHLPHSPLDDLGSS